jgi:hypothetical protein
VPQGGPVQQVIDTTRGLGEALPAPLRPLTGEVMNALPGFAPR